MFIEQILKQSNVDVILYVDIVIKLNILPKNIAKEEIEKLTEIMNKTDDQNFKNNIKLYCDLIKEKYL